VAGAVLYQSPAGPRQIRADMPASLETAILKSLEKDRDLRCQTASELRADLKRVKREIESDARHSGPPPPSIASAPAGSSSASSTPQSSDAQVAVTLLKRHRVLVSMGVGGVALMLAIGMYSVLRQRAATSADKTGASNTSPLASDFEITQLTTSGNAVRPAISPDGKYVAYIQQDGDTFSLWIRQVATASNVKIVEHEPGIELAGPTVTPDGAFVDFFRWDPRSGSPALWRVPFLGGTPRRLVENVWTSVGWSPDGQHMAFVRANVSANADSLVIADVEGRNERVLATRRRPSLFYSRGHYDDMARPSWSPDGRVIALIGVQFGTERNEVVFVDVVTGAETVRDSQGVSFPHGVAWLGPTAILFSQGRAPASPVQLWRMSYPDGAVSPWTNDVLNYVEPDVTADRSSMVTSRSEKRVAIWVSDPVADRATEVVSPYANIWPATVVWAGERLLYDSQANGVPLVAGVIPGSGAPVEIISPAVWPGATSDGSTIVFEKGFSRSNEGLWKINVTGGAPPTQLVSGDAGFPKVTADNRHVIFQSFRSGVFSPWMVPIDGGEPREIIRMATSGKDISPDGRRLFFEGSEKQNERKWFVCELPACSNRVNPPIPANAAFGRGFTPDGRSITYVDTSFVNIWTQPLEGGPPRQITHFTDRRIESFAWSRDGSRLALVRSTTTSDIVLFRLKGSQTR
jgi:Tol biopolymer transport system component